MARRTRRKKRSTARKIVKVASGIGKAVAIYRLVSVGFFSLLMVGFGLLFIFVGGSSKPMSKEELERENERRRKLNKPPVRNQGSPGTAIAIGVSLIVVAALIFGFSLYSFTFMKNHEDVAAAYGGYEGVGFVRRNAPPHLKMLL